ncbi:MULTISPECIES: efflux RND transporter periplasmic adaptor subunit [Legionella]|uniref:Efflux RND transporter periplasmic adaptor subunit n=1 Tax=Legionella septentrionalis TaxID=2498109 RepID=A0A433JIH2_9GAMM|nr:MULTISPECIES: efflux RND transporter periplasmic adaptor subunit [Legionella]MCP0913375.1 efflux RND transporter periplasmic adaptor subunit [Legionella sp. 27cVA30]RUQ85093.1 efflux RND transporter periplasmic adaptor subunit [Legionella septentrionalis]RUQ95164.1 efflux RND transporter periplasmic adaptor subunit [Legionella septentrionalis]RUR08987.1 efflux RND transporter periplasmic adaptor subunit [Legionella septentrionalis]RUR14885.1 efflux RND transporter periplasmic adaptor subuni
MKKTYQNISLFFLFIILSSFLFYQYFHAKSAQEGEQTSKKMQVRIIHPKPTVLSEPFLFSARIYPIESALIFARANGFVQERLVDIGDQVKSGTLLARLSSPELEEQIKQAEAQVRLQEARVKLADLEFQRAQKLVTTGAVARSIFDEKQAEYQVALATLDLNKAQLMRLRKVFDYTNIRAPFDGIISERNIEKGDRINATDATPMFKLIRTNQLRVVVDVPQSQLFSIEKNAVANLSFAELPGRTFKIKFFRLAKEVDEDSGTMRVEFILDNKNNKLQAGLSGEVSIQIMENKNILLIPANALSVRDGKSSVVLVDKNSEIQFRAVVTGRIKSTNNVEILSGLSADDNVVINPNALLFPGQKVEMIAATNK